jgi:hypothetical protein
MKRDWDIVGGALQFEATPALDLIVQVFIFQVKKFSFLGK